MSTTRMPKVQRQKQIAEAALRILATEGAAQLTSRHIGDAVGISDAAVFRHFRDKDAVIEAAIDRFESMLEDSPAPQGVGPLDRLRAFFVHRLTRVRKHPEVLGLAFNDRLAEVAGKEGAARVQRVVRQSMATVRKAIREAQATRELPEDVPTRILVWTFQGVMRGAAGLRSGPDMSRDPDAIFNDFLRAIGATPAPGVDHA